MRAPKDAYLWWEMRVEMRLSTSTQGFSSYTVSKKALATKQQHQIETKKLNQRLFWAKLSTVVLIGWQRPLKNLLTLGTQFYNKLSGVHGESFKEIGGSESLASPIDWNDNSWLIQHIWKAVTIKFWCWLVGSDGCKEKGNGTEHCLLDYYRQR